jgi:hypothetical protein
VVLLLVVADNYGWFVVGGGGDNNGGFGLLAPAHFLVNSLTISIRLLLVLCTSGSSGEEIASVTLC